MAANIAESLAAAQQPAKERNQRVMWQRAVCRKYGVASMAAIMAPVYGDAWHLA
jgi:hypothetical protein